MLESALKVAAVALFVACCFAEDANEVEQTGPYKAPQCSNCLFLETFEGDWEKGWIQSTNEKYNGRVKGTVRESAGLVNDHGMILPVSHRFYGVTKALPQPIDNDNNDFVIQYELSLLDRIDCGGAYLKLLSYDKTFTPAALVDNTPYTIMFGPDRCGPTNKIHVIFRHTNPRTGQIEEKHMLDSPTFPNDRLSHVYTLKVSSKDSTYNVLVDGSSVKSGSLITDFDPSFQPPPVIDDPNDFKPDDWVDEIRIPDTTATKPNDWDDDAPMMVPDMTAVKPKGWLDDEPALIPDKTARKPDDWDDEEDGDFEPPMIPNPACEKVGCGEWKVPMIRNTAYHGKWTPPMIPNPNFNGPWKPRSIDNPAYYEEKNPGNFTPIGAIALELWTTNKDLVFDNILITRDLKAALDYAKQTWGVRHEVEKVTHKSELKEGAEGLQKYVEMVTEVLSEHPIEAAVGGSVVLCLALYLCLRSSSSGVDEEARHKKDDDDAQPDDDDDDILDDDILDDDNNDNVNADDDDNITNNTQDQGDKKKKDETAVSSTQPQSKAPKSQGNKQQKKQEESKEKSTKKQEKSKK